MNEHIITIHEGKKPHKCLICDYSASQKAHLKSHIKWIHEGYKKQKKTAFEKSYDNS